MRLSPYGMPLQLREPRRTSTPFLELNKGVCCIPPPKGFFVCFVRLALFFEDNAPFPEIANVLHSSVENRTAST